MHATKVLGKKKAVRSFWSVRTSSNQSMRRDKSDSRQRQRKKFRMTPELREVNNTKSATAVAINAEETTLIVKEDLQVSDGNVIASSRIVLLPSHKTVVTSAGMTYHGTSSRKRSRPSLPLEQGETGEGSKQTGQKGTGEAKDVGGGPMLSVWGPLAI